MCNLLHLRRNSINVNHSKQLIHVYRLGDLRCALKVVMFTSWNYNTTSFVIIMPDHMYWKMPVYPFDVSLVGDVDEAGLTLTTHAVSFHLCPNKRLSKQSWGCWVETPSRPLWRHCNVFKSVSLHLTKATQAFLISPSGTEWQPNTLLWFILQVA